MHLRVVESIAMRQRPCPPALVVLVAVGCLAGCSSKPARPATYPVSGTVTWKSRPVEAARVVFVPTTSEAEAAAGVTDAAGKYQLTTFVAGDGAQAGEYRVKVSKYDTKRATADEKQKYMTFEEEQKIYAEDERPTPPAKNLLPKKFESDITSGIVHTVTKGPTTLDIKIE
jgi:hypothetical protein